MVRTQGGILYETFRENGFVALDHNEVPLSVLTGLRKKLGTDQKILLAAIRNEVRAVHEGLIAVNQTRKLIFGDPGLSLHRFTNSRSN